MQDNKRTRLDPMENEALELSDDELLNVVGGIQARNRTPYESPRMEPGGTDTGGKSVFFIPDIFSVKTTSAKKAKTEADRRSL